MKRGRLLVIFMICLATISVSAADPEINAAVKAMKSHYGIKQTHIPWIARAFMKPLLWGSGVRLGFAVFEDQALPSQTTVDELDRVIGPALGPEWHSFITSVSTRNGERTVIFVRTVKNQMQLFIVSAERDETSVVKVRLDKKSIRMWLKEPQERGRNRSGKERATVEVGM